MIHFGDHVADRADVLTVGKPDVRRCHAQEEVTMLSGIERVREVVVGKGRTTVPDFEAHEVVLDVALAVAPGKGAVLILTEVHHVAAVVERVERIDRVREEIPAIIALRIDDADLRVEVPFERAAHGIVPDGVGSLAREVLSVVEEVEAVLEFGIDLHRTHLRHGGAFIDEARGFNVDGRAVNLVDVGVFFRLAVEEAREFDLDRVEVVGVEAENRNAPWVRSMRRETV